jgi:hypothetical protein
MSGKQNSFSRVVEAYQDQEKITRTEGRRGVENLARLTAALGYHDPMYFGQFSAKASIGDLIVFFEDNPGAIEAVVEWIKDQSSPEWRTSLEDQLADTDEPA